MKRIFSATGIALLVAAAPSWASSSADLREIQSYAPDADLSTLSDHQVLMLLNIIHGLDREGRKYQQVRGFLLRVEGRSIVNTLFK